MEEPGAASIALAYSAEVERERRSRSGGDGGRCVPHFRFFLLVLIWYGGALVPQSLGEMLSLLFSSVTMQVK